MSTQDAPILASIDVHTPTLTITRHLTAPVIKAEKSGDPVTYDMDTDNIEGRIRTQMRRLLNGGIVDVVVGSRGDKQITQIPGGQITRMVATIYVQDEPLDVTDDDSGVPAVDTVPFGLNFVAAESDDSGVTVAAV